MLAPRVLFAVAGFLLLSASLSLGAEEGLIVTFVNDSRFEINSIKITGSRESGGGAVYRGGVSIMPGSSGGAGFDGASSLTGVSLDMGVARFDFDDVAPLSGRSRLKLRVAFDEASSTPLLILDGEGRKAVSGTSGDAWKTIDVEAGPIWDNEFAKGRCPEVVDAWLRDHPGQKAAWTGQWVTTIMGEMSVCQLRIEADGPAQGVGGADARGGETYGDGVVRVAGTYTRLLSRDEGHGPEFAEVVAAGSMADLRRLAGLGPAPEEENPDNREHALALKVRFAGTVWRTLVYPNDSDFDLISGYDEETARPCQASMYAYADGGAARKTLELLRAQGWRPWMSRVRLKGSSDDERVYKFSESASGAREAWAAVMEENAGDERASQSTLTLFVPEDHYEAVAARSGGSGNGAPGILFHRGLGRVMTLEYLCDASPFIAFSR